MISVNLVMFPGKLVKIQMLNILTMKGKKKIFDRI